MNLGFREFRAKHSSYFSAIFHFSLFIGYLYSLFLWAKDLLAAIQSNSFLGFVLVFLLQFLYMLFNGILTALILTVVLSILLFVPYLVLRGLLH